MGGWLQSEANLEQESEALVLGHAVVSGEALVSGQARVSGTARVSEFSQASGKATCVSLLVPVRYPKYSADI